MTHTLDSARTYCQGSWRLPTIKELQSLVDIRAYGPAIDTVAFPNTSSNYFWSSSLVATNTSLAWVVNFNYGNTYSDIVTRYNQVRCVR